MQSPVAYRPLSLLVGLAFFMEQLDATIIAPAIPDLAVAFGVTPLSLNLTMTIYLLFSVAFIPAGGHLAARWGTRMVFRGALLLFAASSLLCAMSPNLLVLATGRALQGVAAALMVPVGRMAIVHATPRRELVLALAWMVTPAMLGPLMGPPLGGIIITWTSWHWIFLINLPIGLAGWYLAGRWMPQIRESSPAPFDAIAWMLLALFLAGVIATLEWLRHGHASAPEAIFGLGFFALMALLVSGYIKRSNSAARPLLDVALLRVQTFSTSFWASALVRMGYGALPFLLPLMLQIGLNFSALDSGLILLASGAVAFVTKMQTARVLRRWGFKRVLAINGVLCALGLGVCGLFTAAWSIGAIAFVVSVAGFFRSIQFNALAAIAYADLPAAKIASATTLNTMGQQLAVMLGIAVSSLVVDFSSQWGGRVAPATSDFAVAFGVLGMLALLALPSYLRLSPTSGSDLSGHRASA